MAAVVRPRLEELPEELVSNIAIKLDSDSSFAFRLTCRALEEKSLHEWAVEYFGHKAIVPSSSSLKVLTSIAESPKLRDYVHVLYIIPALFSDRGNTCCHGKSCKLKHTVRQEENMHHYIQDQKELKQDGLLQERLTHIFKLLPKLHGVTFTDGINHVPADVSITGHASYIRRTNNAMVFKPAYPEDKEFYRWKGYVWKAMMHAIAFSGISTLQTLHSDLDSVKNPLTLNNLTFSGRTLHHLGKTLRSLKGLRLQMTSSSSPTEFDDHDFKEGKAILTMKNLAQLMPSATDLVLTFIYNPPSSIMCRTFMDNISLSKLTKLRLNEVHIDSKFLAKMICALTNVENLFLEYIQLTDGTWKTILKAIQPLPGLKHLHLTNLATFDGAASFLKPLNSRARRGANSDPYSAFGTGATGAGAANGAGLGPFDFLDDEDEYGDDEDGYDSEDEGSDNEDDTDGSMPDLEPQSSIAATTLNLQPIPPPPGSASTPAQIPLPTSLGQALHSLYSDSNDETDDEMAYLESLAPPPSSHATTGAPAPAAPNATDHFQYPPAPDTTTIDPNSLDYRLGQGPGRGRIICLKTAEEIKEYIPRFIKEYHVIDSDEVDDLFAGGMGAYVLGAGAGGAGGGVGGGFGGGAGAGAGAGQAAAGAGGFGAGLAPPPGVANMLNALLGGAGGGGGGGHHGHGHGHGAAGFTIQGPFFGPAPPPTTAGAGANGGVNAGANGTNAATNGAANANGAAPAMNFHPTTVEDGDEEGWSDEE